MAKVQFEAISPQGRRVKGAIDANTAAEAKAKLEAEGFKITSMGSASSTPVLSFDFGGGVNQKELQVFTRQMSTLVASGVHLVQGLELLANGTRSASFKSCLIDVRDQVANGKSLFDAMSKYPKVFDRLYLNMIAAGEQGGVLDVVFNRLAGYIEKVVKLRGNVKSGLWYRVSIIFVATVVILAIMIFVIPQFQKLFANAGQELPAMTVFVITISNIILTYWYILLALVGGGAFTFYKWYNSEEGRAAFDTFILRVPVFGTLVTTSAVARFCRTLGTLIASGVAIIDALDISGNVTGNKAIESVITGSKDAITKGRTLSANFAASPLIPGMVSQMIAVGEQTGALEEMLNKVADFYESEVDNTVTAMTSIIEPMLMIVLGGIIAVLVIAMYLPIFNLAGVVGG